MIKKKYFFVIFLLIGILFISIYLFSGKTKPAYTIQTYQIEEGWGYRILKNNKAIINQYRIPAIQEKHTFPSEKSARIVGEKVLEKIQLNKMPSISIDDLMDLMVVDSLEQPLILNDLTH
ncbi:hypothetical protein BZG01_04965 [Labilibaculum manganireducens]|uniref:DUF4907 domain-containing protein n=1 Tax=Labilibaculum manganireducens TaxID=1940525 RepID=A0A2N3ICV7_9BACT|nr:DUF4907 domain-containing protein [Labilibaculum manganireducens]PKQ68108.1 hypothetical protein BZG01_04965 [Labilibaculum manganireducens]